jgi:hypothetical protein
MGENTTIGEKISKLIQDFKVNILLFYLFNLAKLKTIEIHLYAVYTRKY